MPETISNRDARRVFLHLQGLGQPPRAALKTEALGEMVDRLGYVQVDSINTVERAHHQILFSRNQTYRQKQLAALHERHRAVFENWTHDAAVIPAAFYPYWKHRFARERVRMRERLHKYRRGDFEHFLDDVRARIREKGPTMSRDFAREEKSGGGWWDWHPEKTALEYLWRTGEIAIARRDGFQKVYDLAERIIPEEHFGREVSHGEFVDWACSAALDRLGFATHGEIAAFFELVSPAEAKQWVERQGNALVELSVECVKGAKPRLAYARPGIEGLLDAAPEPPARLRVLSPFDPLLRDRARAERLFGFFYRIEVFVPEAKREYGYYVFPLLERDRLIGRIDMKHHRNRGTLDVKGLWLEPGVRWSSGREERLMSELERMRRFTAADEIAFRDGWHRGTRG